MSRKKILVCGSAGFLMSNFIRYLYYMTKTTKEFEIVSVDKLVDIKDYKNIYINKDHKFYIGDITDEFFLRRLLHIEKPDYIINGCYYNNNQKFTFNEIILATTNLVKSGIPLIQINGCTKKSYDKLGFWKFIQKILLEYNKVCIEIPNCFGSRQKLNSHNIIPWLLHQFLMCKAAIVEEIKLPWIFSEDLASLIWFIIENNLQGNIQTPIIGYASEKDIAELIKNIYKKDFDIMINNKDNNLVVEYDYLPINGWKPDSTSLNNSLEKTIRWFDANRWSLSS